MPKFKVGDRVQYVVDGVVSDTGTVVRQHEEKETSWWAMWEGTNREQHFNDDNDNFRRIPHTLEETVAMLTKSLDEVKATLQQLIAKQSL
jgi:hypothetical protein